MTGELRDHWKDRSSLWSALLFVALALGYSCATGPFRAPDEPAHFFRAYGISEGQLVAQRERSDLLGSYLPANIPRLAHVLGAYPQQPVIALAPGQLTAARHLELKRGHRGFVHFPGAAMHSPVVYIPAALGIALGRLLHLGPLFLFYFARCSNAAVVAASLGWGIRRVWRPAPFLAGVALFPMTLAQVGTVSADAVTFAVTFCWLAEVLSLRAKAEDSPRPWWRWALFALLLSQLRFPYPLLGLLIFCVPVQTRGRALSSSFSLPPVCSGLRSSRICRCKLGPWLTSTRRASSLLCSGIRSIFCSCCCREFGSLESPTGTRRSACSVGWIFPCHGGFWSD